MGYFVKKDKHGSEGFVLPAGPTSDRPATPVVGVLRFNTDVQSLEYFDGTNFVDLAKTGRVPATVQKFVGDGVTDTFTMTVSYTSAADIVVFVNGVYQAPVNHYTVSGFDITFTSPPPDSLQVAIIHGLSSTLVLPGDVYDVPNL